MNRQTTPLWIHLPGPHHRPAGGWTTDRDKPDGLIGDADALRLTVNPEGPLRLGAPDGSLGRLTLPRGVALDRELRVYLMVRDQERVLIHDPARMDYDQERPFQPIPVWISDWHTKPKAAGDLVSIAADDRALYVADGRGSVRMFARDNWVLQEIWKLREPPVDVAIWRGSVFLLTSDALLVVKPGDIDPELLKVRPDEDGPWRRMAVDREGLVYVLCEREFDEKRRDALRVIDPNRPGWKEFVLDPGEVRDRFYHPGVVSWPANSPFGSHVFFMPGTLTEECHRTCPDFDPTTHPAGAVEPPGFLFGQDGTRLPANYPLKLRDRLYQTTGTWISNSIDSRLFHCAWDILELEIGRLPAGTQIRVRTKTADETSASPPNGEWDDALALGGSPDPAFSAGPLPPEKALINSPPGRFLWMEITMQGSGYDSPALNRVSLKLPRQSLTRYLPPVFLQDESSRRFLTRFLAVFQDVWDDLERRVDHIAGLADPRAVPESHLDFLAGWLGESLGVEWGENVRREFLKRLPQSIFAPRNDDTKDAGGATRATPGGMRDYLRNLLWAIRGGEDPFPADQGDAASFPYIIEGFRDRNYRLLPQKGGAFASLSQLGRGDSDSADSQTPVAPLWGADTRERFQLGQSSRLDESRLMPDDSADLDVFRHHAHKFRIVVPSAMISTADEEALLRRAVEAEKPAHTAYTLDLVGARFRVGVQSTVGIDTIVGGIPRAYLGNANTAPPAPSAPPKGVLGLDTVLSKGPRPKDRRSALPGYRIEGAVRL